MYGEIFKRPGNLGLSTFLGDKKVFCRQKKKKKSVFVLFLMISSIVQGEVKSQSHLTSVIHCGCGLLVVLIYEKGAVVKVLRERINCLRYFLITVMQCVS